MENDDGIDDSSHEQLFQEGGFSTHVQNILNNMYGSTKIGSKLDTSTNRDIFFNGEIDKDPYAFLIKFLEIKPKNDDDILHHNAFLKKFIDYISRKRGKNDVRYKKIKAVLDILKIPERNQYTYLRNKSKSNKRTIVGLIEKATEDAKVKAEAAEAAKKAPVEAKKAPASAAPAPVQTVDLLNEIEKLLNSPPTAPGPAPAPAPAPVPTLTPYAVVTINIQPKDNSPDTVPQKYTADLANPNILSENYQIGTQPLVKVDSKKLKACKYYLYNTQNTQNNTYYYLPDTELSEPPPHILSSVTDLLSPSE
jgi:hypothetical protein